MSELVDTIDQDAKDRGRSWWEKFTDSFTTLTTGTIAGIVAALMTLFSKLVAALTPFAIAMARAIAIVLSVLGVYLLLLPGRYADSVKWMGGADRGGESLARSGHIGDSSVPGHMAIWQYQATSPIMGLRYSQFRVTIGS